MTSSTAPGPRSEQTQIADVTSRLERRYPNGRISRIELERRVREFYRQFDAARIRTFITVFVERLVRHSIERPSTGPTGPPPTPAATTHA